MSDPLHNVEQLVNQWERDATEKAARYESLAQEVQQISISGSSADGSVTVTVGNNGIPSDVTMTDRVRELRPEQIAAAVMDAMRKAQSRYPAELARIMGETVGDDAATRHILAEAERNFPASGDEPSRRPPSSPGGDDEDFGDTSVLR